MRLTEQTEILTRVGNDRERCLPSLLRGVWYFRPLCRLETGKARVRILARTGIRYGRGEVTLTNLRTKNL